MPQSTNLNISPYFDDFDKAKDFYKVLFKPGYPVQARELTTLQSFLQNQVEQFGNHIFKDGSVVIPGQLSYNKFEAVKVLPSYLGVDVDQYLSLLVGQKIVGNDSKVEAKIEYCLPAGTIDNEFDTLYVSYLATGTGNQETFNSEERLNLASAFTSGSIVFQSGEGFANTTPDAIKTGSAVIVGNGVYYLRGYFVEVDAQTLILDPYNDEPDYRVGFDVIEEIITPDDDQSLNDNAQGFSNYAAPGADRLKITAILSKRELGETSTENFVSLMEVRKGQIYRNTTDTPIYNILGDELARRTSEESGDYYVKPFKVEVRNTLNDGIGNNGVFNATQRTYNNLTPSEDLGTYKVSPGKAYVKGYEATINGTSYVDFAKPRTTRREKEASIAYETGSTYTLNRVYGAPTLDMSSPFIVSLRSERIGVGASSQGGKEIGLARVYDFALESGSYSATNTNTNEWDVTLFDIDPYVELSVNQNVTLSTPVRIQGKASGASGFLRYDVNNAGIATVYGVKGSFAANEKLIFNGKEDTSRFTTLVTEFDTSDVQSLTQQSGSVVFAGDVIQQADHKVGFASITARAAGSSTISIASGSSNFVFNNNAKVGQLVRYTVPGDNVPTINRITAVDVKSVTVTGVTTVTGVCEGSPNTSAQSVNDLELLGSKFQSSSDNALFTKFPKPYVKSIDFSDAQLTIRKEYSVTITNNQTNTLEADESETFLPYDEERYVLIRNDGSHEILRSDKFTFNADSSELTISGLGANDNNARLIATLRKINVKSKVKNRNRVQRLVIANDANTGAGIGTTTLNNGLTSSSVYGTRVQDEEICLNISDVTKVYGIFESSTTSNASEPELTFLSISGPSNKTGDLLVGERVIGRTSGAVCVHTGRVNDLKISFVSLNQNKFAVGETVDFVDSGHTAVVSDVSIADKNISEDFTLDTGKTDTLYNYSKLVRKSGRTPTRRLTVIFESGSYSGSDTGDITTVNSYDGFDYSDIAPERTGQSDLIDIRPRVSEYVTSVRSPFEFLSRTFSETNNSAKNILASDESVVLTYDHYLPRIDSIYFTQASDLQLVTGVPAEFPAAPKAVDGAMKIAEIFLPPYLVDPGMAILSLPTHKRYQMKDIYKLENRIKNLEDYTTLNLLETKTESLSIKDENGLDRFKSGFFVDNFRNINFQTKKGIVKNSIDRKNQELRPTHFTTEIDLLIGSKSLIGIGASVDPNADARFVTDLIGANVRRTGQLITLDYEDVEYVSNPFGTRSENVTPYLVTDYFGTIELQPSSDLWTDQTRLPDQHFEIDLVSPAREQMAALGYDTQNGWSNVVWDSWQTDWVGIDVNSTSSTSSATNRTTTPNGGGGRFNWRGQRMPGGRGGVNIIDTTVETTTTETTTTISQGQSRTGRQIRIEEESNTVSEGDRVVSSELSAFMRSRNIEFTARKFRPFTEVHAFFDGEDVSAFITPKLLEIEMTSGTFQVGETVVGRVGGDQEIRFRVAQPNHRYGPFNSPTDLFFFNPYDQESTALLPSTYSATTEILNIDIASLAEQPQGDFFGRLLAGATLRGQTSGAQASVSRIRLVSDNVGTIIGSFLIPDSSVASNPQFETGTKTFRLTSDRTNNSPEGSRKNEGEENYYAMGLLNEVQETFRTTRTPRIDSRTRSETRTLSASDTSTTSAVTGVTVVDRTPAPPPEPEARGGGGGGGGDPLAQTFTVAESGGCYITKVDVFFRYKDSNSVPVVCQLRSVELGTPTTDVYPFGEVVIDPADVNLSEDGTVATTITFPSPVYLKGGNTEHALVLLSDSTSYEVWISRLGEADITTAGLAESQQVIVTEQPLLGSMFKSQNGSAWTPTQYEDVKFTLYRADFTSINGNVSFYNPELSRGNKQIARLMKNSVEMNARRLRVGLAATVTDTNFVVGTQVFQGTGVGHYVSAAGVADGNLTITNAGLGYSNGNFPNTALTNVTGSGSDAIAHITVLNNVATAATITTGGSGYRVGDVLTVTSLGGSPLGQNMRLSVGELGGLNELVIDKTQGTFGVGSSISYLRPDGLQVGLNDASVNATSVTTDNEAFDGLHIKINHKNHGMYALNNNVIISDVKSDIIPTKISSAYGRDSVTDLFVDDVTQFTTYENVGVAATNPGYVRIEDEIIAYTGVTGNSLTGITRSIDETKAFSYDQGTEVSKYEVNGISLRRINKQHTLQDVSFASTKQFDLDYYYLKIDPSGDGVALPEGLIDRSTSGVFAPLYITETKATGGGDAYATQNIPFELVRPNIQTFAPIQTSVSAALRTVSGSSVDGNEEAYLDQGFEPINLNDNNYMSSPRVVAARSNETAALSTLPGSKSFEVNVLMKTANSYLSPAIDLDRVGMVLSSNRVNSPISDFSADNRVSSILDDPHTFVYATNPIELELPATTLRVMVSAYVNTQSDLKMLYAISNDIGEEMLYYPFPGYDNKDAAGNVIDASKNSGLSDTKIVKSDIFGNLSRELNFRSLTFTVDNLPDFRYFSIKLVGSGTDQAHPPRVQDFRVIALA